MARKTAQLLFVFALVAALAVAVPTVGAPPADAQVQVWYARVTHISDGDTFEVAWDQGDSAPTGVSQPDKIRVLGVDTNEVSSSQCFADAAESFIEARIPVGTVVRLEARDEQSHAGGRPLRHVFFGSGYGRNLALEVIEAGLGLAASYDHEPDHRRDYYEAAEQASLDGVGMWAEGACGGNPGSWPDLDVHVNWDAEGADNNNENGEYVQIRNNGPGSLVMNGWSIRSSARNSGNTLSIPDGTTIPAGGKLRIRMGSGNDTATNVYMGQTRAWFDNDSDVLYLRDNHLNIRAFQVWPCTSTCGEYGTLVVEELNYDAPGDDNAAPNGEWVRLRNVGNGTLDLTDWKVQDNGVDYHFADGTTLGEGETVTIRVGNGADTVSTKYWGNSNGIFANSGDAVWVFSDRHIPVDCHAYGSASCDNEPVRGAIRLTAHYDAKGSDRLHPNREWVALENTSDERVNVSGYRVRVGSHVYVFPSNTRIDSGKRLRLRVGSGSNTKANHYWGRSSGIMPNSGGSVQLRDRDNDVVLEHRWVCGDCGPDGPFVIDRVRYNAPGVDRTNPNGEWIRLRNAGSDRASLRDYLIKVGKKQHVFLRNVWLDPGETVKLRIGRGSDTAANVYWGYNRDILRNKGKRVTLYTPYRERVDCHAWGDRSCSG